jgi:hypothetical protein
MFKVESAYQFTWNNNSGTLYMELETGWNGMLIDNFSVSSMPPEMGTVIMIQ